jgi:dolichol-phosphate mannosyltransferase
MKPEIGNAGNQAAGPLLSIVVPVYKEERNVPVFVQRVSPVLAGLSPDYEIIFAMDPSPDRTEEVILELAREDPRVKLIKFSRRVGQPMATLGGLQYSRGQAVIVMDVDLQDPPELINDMVARWREGFEVVMAQRRSRQGETLLKRIVSYVGYKIINHIAEVEIPPNTGDFRLMSRRVVAEVNRLSECHGFLRGLVALVGFRQTCIQFDRAARFSGAGNYNRFWGSLRIGFNGIICFSSYPLSLCTQLGAFMAAGSAVAAGVFGALRLTGVLAAPAGHSWLALLICGVGGLQLLGMGLLGAYIARIYEEVRHRPKFIVEKTVGLP